jgi:putative PIN family toxin of toxin-antitoxin system
MIKAVLDTNILVSASLFPNGNPANIVKRGLAGDFEVIVSDTILQEFRRCSFKSKLITQYGLNQQKVIDFCSAFLPTATLVISKVGSVAISRDRDDDHVLSAAIMSKANYIVTGDKDLLVLNGFRDVLITAPSDFIELLP